MTTTMTKIETGTARIHQEGLLRGGAMAQEDGGNVISRREVAEGALALAEEEGDQDPSTLPLTPGLLSKRLLQKRIESKKK
mmetsp:Transcript_14111/g.30674  ORF Transcript_14111/g.30674 Transcript_14111/m.30674 type:complete len:81 (+) Transcript_14111:254-496(+)